MTRAIAAEPGLPGPDTPVLVDRPLNPHRLVGRMSVFADDVWDVTPGLFEAHLSAVRLKFQPVPDRFRATAKVYTWHLVNHDDPHPRRATRNRRLALRTIALALPRHPCRGAVTFPSNSSPTRSAHGRTPPCASRPTRWSHC
jgi:hypothetical protein